MPLGVVGKHAQKDVGAHVRFCAVTDGPNLQIDALDTAKGLFDLPKALVGAHGVFGTQHALVFAGADDVDTVEVCLSPNGFFVAFSPLFSTHKFGYALLQ